MIGRMTLCKQVGESIHIFQALAGVSSYHMVRVTSPMLCPWPRKWLSRRNVTRSLVQPSKPIV